MKTTFTLLLLFLTSLGAFAQTYSELVSLSFSHLEQNKYKSFEDTYPKLFTAYLKEQATDYQAALTATADGDMAKAFAALDRVVTDSLLLDEIQTDKSFAALHTAKEWNSLLFKIKRIEQGYHKKARKALLAINAHDQSIRLLVLEAYRKYGKESNEALDLRTRMKEIDAASAMAIQEIINKYGWLGVDKVGYFGNQVYFLAIQHAEDTVVQQKYLPIMRKAVTEGNAKPWQYAFLQDRILMNQGKRQIYGTQKIVSDDPAKSYIIPLQDPENVDSLRAEVGLGPLQEALQEDGMTWDLAAYKQRLPEIEKMYRERYLQAQAAKQKQKP
ncbi:DUF6624 domain-containing protein [Pontibacter mangrovi]|uniref:PpiC domain-containing protein n=1 Tax=Pontibacter mangrovi TaxID=2589816 RepID=A0A501WAE3_9BACT|nr:DUF6624 domain-containing protein [Pontibacter mangrovi]TPE44181.1 hypothetical protein FJM65_08415 [Pontibacter mangrovi]